MHPLKDSEDAVPILAESLECSKEDETFPSAIIYALKRESVDDVARRLRALGLANVTSSPMFRIAGAKIVSSSDKLHHLQ